MSPRLRTRGTGANRTGMFIRRMEMLISILSARGIKIVEGASPSTNGVDTVFMPPLADDASEEDFLKYFCSAAHEQSHFFGKSIVSKMPKGGLPHFCANAVDDIRCEFIQEDEFPGLVGYRKREYKIDCEGFLKKEFESASVDNIKKLVVAMLKYMIIKNRVRQLEAEDVVIYASEDLISYYDKYLLDIEDVLDELADFDHALSVGEVIYNRIKDLITDEETPEEPKGKGEPGDGEPSEGGEGEPSDKSDSGDESEGGGDDESEDGSGGSELSDEEKKEIEAKVKTIMDELDAEDGLVTVADSYTDDVAAIASKDGGSYKSANGVKDLIYPQRSDVTKGFATLKRGKKLLGSIGSKMTKLFVSQTRKRNLNNQFEGRLDVTALVSDPSDVREDIFRRTTPGRLDKAAVCFAVDNSGSMSGTRIEKAYEILSGLLYYLDKVGIPTEAIGFTAELTYSSTARDGAVRHTIIKGYDEPFKMKAVSRCYPPSDLEQNVELEALYYLAPRLFQRPEGKKVMFVLSDGAPAFGPSVLNRKMGKAYKAYIERLREMGMFVVGFGIDCDVSKYFGAHCINTSTDKLGEAIVKKLTEILNRR